MGQMNRHRKTQLKTLGLLTLLIMGFQNCARSPLLGNSGGDSGSNNQSSAAAADPISTPYALLTGEQLLKGMFNVTGTASTTAVTNEFNSRANVFSLNPDLKSTTSPMMIAVTSLGGEVCNNLLTVEAGTNNTGGASGTAKAAADRAFFGSIDFTKAASNVSAAQYDAVIRSMARNFWGRNENPDEHALLVAGKSEFLANLDTAKVTQAVSTRDLMLFTCGAMISSIDAMTY